MPTVAIDFDGVLADYHGWQGMEHLDPPIGGAIDFLWRVKRAGYDIVIFSTRGADRPEAIQSWVTENGGPNGIQVTNVKPPALVYIDDRAYRFDGDWDAAFSAINQKPHWQEDWAETASGLSIPQENRA